MSLNAGLVTKEEIFARIQEHKNQIRALGVKKIGLFGSFLRSQQTASSDVDFLVEFVDGEKTFDHFMELSFLLEDLFHLPVELVTPESLSPYIGPLILHEVEYVSIAA
ncbi:MAG: nucleotidyltransferase family protein [Nitrospirales bacterium]|nr:nucleotidyltransferase family protein [Nitrospirales bacterium]